MLKEMIFSKLNDYKVAKFSLHGSELKLQIELRKDQNAAIAEENIKNLLPEYNVNITFFMKEQQVKPFKKIIGISSGKGGVGKSTVSLHIAFALKEMGYKIGILDADIYAPSIPVFLNENRNPGSQDGRLIDPIITEHGFELLSMGLFLQQKQSAMWRGPMLSMAFTQFLEQGNWNCDYLIIDFPPGTTDIHMACSKIAPEAEILLVGMPNKVVYADVMRMYVVLRALNLKISGLVDNMAYSICKNCAHEEHFETKAKIEEVEKLMQLPIFPHFHSLNEAGYPADYRQQGEKEYFDKLAKILIDA